MELKFKSSQRRKQRYLLLEAENKEEVQRAIVDYIGILGWAKAAPFFVKEDGKKIILAINRKEIDNVRAAFEVSDSNIKVLRVSGTLKGLKK